MTEQPAFRLGTRGSPLALAQAHETRERLLAAHGWAEDAVVIEVIRTTGDRIRDRPLSEVGGKGLFTKELEEALLGGRIDAAVHSMKDMPTELPDGLAIAATLPREDPRDAFLSPVADAPGALPPDAIVGSSSLRRQAQLRHRRPDLRVVMFRGNVETRLNKLAAGEVHATLLAHAGLRRLGLADRVTRTLEPEEMLPAVAQGAICLEVAQGGTAPETVAALNHPETSIATAAERAFLAVLDGSCRTPIAGLALLDGDEIWLRGEIIRPDGSERIAVERRGPAADAIRLGADAGEEARRRAGPGFFDG
ncbi:MAG: hydroxymethylbilane synthase [Alphaproteobacteria bacterium]